MGTSDQTTALLIAAHLLHKFLFGNYIHVAWELHSSLLSVFTIFPKRVDHRGNISTSQTIFDLRNELICWTSLSFITPLPLLHRGPSGGKCYFYCYKIQYTFITSRSIFHPHYFSVQRFHAMSAKSFSGECKKIYKLLNYRKSICYIKTWLGKLCVLILYC